jgi:hypothetical protein
MATSGVVRTVGGLGDGQGALGQRPGLGRLAQVLQDSGEGVQPDGDVGVAGPVRRGRDGLRDRTCCRPRPHWLAGE